MPKYAKNPAQEGHRCWCGRWLHLEEACLLKCFLQPRKAKVCTHQVLVEKYECSQGCSKETVQEKHYVECESCKALREYGKRCPYHGIPPQIGASESNGIIE